MTDISYEMKDYEWLVVLGGFAAFVAAFGIGANDVANAFATSVGSKALTVRQACAIAVVMEFCGATFLGGEVVKTIRKGIADQAEFEDNPPLLMFGCLCALIATGVWLLLATRLEMPVSTTHSAVGGMIGMAIASRPSAVIWYKDPDPPDKPLPGGFVGVVLSWVISPVLSGILSSLLFFVVRSVCLRSSEPFARSVKIYPLLVFVCVTIITLFMLMKGLKSDAFDSLTDLDVGVKTGIAMAVGAVVAIIFIPAYMMCKKRIEDGKFQAPSLAIEDAEKQVAGKAEEGKATESKAVDVKELSLAERVKNSVMSSLNTDIHTAVGESESTMAVHKNAERFDKNAEAMFTYLQVFSAAFDAFAHGANDVANAMGPFATIFLLYNGNELGKKQDMGEYKFLILAFGGIAIGFGLLLYGSQILRAIGVKLAVITPSRGFCIEMGSSLVVIIGAHMGLPLSTTHCQVGATMGVALLEGVRGFNKWVLFKTAFGWVFTCFFVGFLSAVIFSFGAYAPMATMPVCHNYTLIDATKYAAMYP